jgi:lipoate synthase
LICIPHHTQESGSAKFSAETHTLKVEALKLGFRHVESGPLVRSSYHALNKPHPPG